MGFSFVYCVVCGCPFDVPPRDEVFDEEHNWASEDPLEDETKQVSIFLLQDKSLALVVLPLWVVARIGRCACNCNAAPVLGIKEKPKLRHLFSYLLES